MECGWEEGERDKLWEQKPSHLKGVIIISNSQQKNTKDAKKTQKKKDEIPVWSRVVFWSG